MSYVTIFTAAYQRAATLPRLYASIQRQTSKHFEWIVVDDGSTDGTEALVRGWASEEQVFPIRYVRQPHGGKHRAHNRAVQMARYEAFFIVDSDDYLADDAIEKVEAWFSEIEYDNRFAGVSGLKAHFDEQIFGGNGGGRVIDATNIEREKYDLLDEKAEVYKTSILRQFPFPEFPGEDFVGEGVVWDVIAVAGYKLRWHPEVTLFCEYQADGLTRNRVERDRRNPLGSLAYLRIMRGFQAKATVQLAYVDWYSRGLGTSAIKNLLPEEGEMIHLVLEVLKNEIRNFVQTQRLRSLALYGMGHYGRSFSRFRDMWGVSVPYAMDRQPMESYDGLSVYLPEEEPEPHADGVLVLIKQYDPDLEAQLRASHRAVAWLADVLEASL